jgi:hydrogenase maturation protease
MAAQIIVLGIGNILLNDDGVGIHLLQYLRLQYPNLSDVTYLDGGVLNFTLTHWLQGAMGLIILDAADLEIMPGAIQVFVDNDLKKFQSKLKRSAHDATILDLLNFGQITGITPKHRAVVAVQYQNIGWGLELSKPVQLALPVAAKAVYELICFWKRS